MSYVYWKLYWNTQFGNIVDNDSHAFVGSDWVLHGKTQDRNKDTGDEIENANRVLSTRLGEVRNKIASVKQLLSMLQQREVLLESFYQRSRCSKTKINRIPNSEVCISCGSSKAEYCSVCASIDEIIEIERKYHELHLNRKRKRKAAQIKGEKDG